MNAMTMSFDFAGMAIQEIHNVERVDRHAARNVERTKQAASFLPSFMSSWIGFIFAQYLDKKSKSLIQNAVFLEGAAYKLGTQIAETFTLPEAELVRVLDNFKPKLSEAIISCEQAVKFFKSRSPDSPTAAAFQKVMLALKQVLSATELLRAVATGSSIAGVLMPYSGITSWEEAVEQQREAFHEVRTRIKAGDNADIDSDLLELASNAILASEARDLKQDQSWVSRMSSRTMH